LDKSDNSGTYHINITYILIIHCCTLRAKENSLLL